MSPTFDDVYCLRTYGQSLAGNKRKYTSGNELNIPGNENTSECVITSANEPSPEKLSAGHIKLILCLTDYSSRDPVGRLIFKNKIRQKTTIASMIYDVREVHVCHLISTLLCARTTCMLK